LTTRLGRISFSINYPDLDFVARRKVWSMFLAKAIKGGKPIDDSDIDRVAQRELNGRQVRTAFMVTLQDKWLTCE
jgi:hypothetical protein